MRNLHKKIIAVSLIGILSIGGILSQACISYADSNKSKSSFNIKQLIVDSYMDLLKSHFNFLIMRQYGYDGLSVDLAFQNPGEFAQHLYDKGIKKGYYFVRIGYEIYDIYFNGDVNPVQPWKQWKGLVRFYSFEIKYKSQQ